MSQPISSTIRAEVLKSVRDEGMPVSQAAKVFGISKNTIRNWLVKEAHGSSRNYILEINTLKKKLDNAYRVIGELTTEVKRSKG